MGLGAFTKSRQDVRISNRDFPFLLCGARMSEGSTACFAVAAHAASTGREWVSLLSPRHTEKQPRKDHSSMGGTQT